jgi:2-phosphosulfolactate phosphatase
MPTVAIDCFPSCVARYRTGYAVVAVDVIRATTVAVTAVSTGRRCFVVSTLEDAFDIAHMVPDAILAGELGGDMPEGFHMNNSPVQLLARNDVDRPVIMLSTSGTQLMNLASECDAAYAACFRNHSATASMLESTHERVVVIGAGSRDEFREEDAMCCAWIAARLVGSGFEPENENTASIIGRWADASPQACLCSNSVGYLRRSGQQDDLQFVLNHIDDLHDVMSIKGNEVMLKPMAVQIAA